MKKKRPFNLTIFILAVALIGMCGFLWFEYRLAKQKSQPPEASAKANPISAAPKIAPNALASGDVIDRTQRLLTGTPNALTTSQVEQLTRLLIAVGPGRLSPETIFGAQQFLSPTQVSALKRAFVELSNRPTPTPQL